MKSENIVIRPVDTIEACQQAEEVQRLAWGMEDNLEVVPTHVLITAQKNGGIVLGAYDEDTMVGFVFGFLGRTPAGRDKLCSHMVGVIPKYQSHGIAEALKWEQRQFALQQGLDLVTWTYDPLQGRNAHLNIAKLGAICRTYIRNLYGEMQDALNAGLPTDRFLVEWWVRSPAVEARFTHRDAWPHPTLEDLLEEGVAIINEVEVNDAGLPATLSWAPHRDPKVLLEVPGDFQAIRKADLKLARDWRLLTRAIFEEYFDAGYAVVDFISHVEDGQRRNFYVLEYQTISNLNRPPVQLSAADRAAIQAGMDLYNAGLYWEAHEAWEEVWLRLPTPEKIFVQGLIQATATFHKYLVQRNAVGAVKLLTTALNKLTRFSDDYMGLDMGPFKRALSQCWRTIIDLGQERIDEFDTTLVPELRWIEEETKE